MSIQNNLRPFRRGLLLAVMTAAPLVAAAAPTSGLIDANFDRSVRPQDDFFRYVNGTWLKDTPIPADKSSYGITQVQEDRNLEWLKAIVEKSAAQKAATGTEAQQIGDLYASYMDEAKLNALGVTPVQPLLAKVDAIKARGELTALFAELERLAVPTPISSYVQPDARDATRYALYLSQAGLGLPDRDFYFEKGERFEKMRAAYLAFATQLFTLAGDARPAEQAQRVMAFETTLAKSQWTKVQNRDPVKTYNLRKVNVLMQQAPGFDWAGWLKGVGVKADTVVVNQPSYLKAFAQLVAKTDLETLKAYTRLRVLSDFAPYLSQPFFDVHFAFKGKALRGIEAPKPRWKRGIDVVENAIGESLGKVFVAEHFSDDSKHRVEAMAQNVITAYGQEIDTLDWMSAATKQKAHEKLAKFTVKVGYPKVWRDYSSIAIKSDDLVGNVQRATAFEVQRNLNKLGKPIDRTEWDMTPQTINAYYNPLQNEIVLPAAILQPPFFDPDADDAMNYGSTGGGTIGHELTHGFDDEGSQFDGDGNLKSWWTKEDRKRFDAKAAQLAKQFDGYEPVKGQHINGKLTLGENIADLGGMVIAHRAWQLALKGQPSPVIDGHSGEERFLAGYALSWLDKTREEALVTMLKSNPHAPPEYRVNGVMVNLPSFHAEYGTQPGDALYKAPADRVRIW
jgi:putative endopeptidase